MDMRKEARRLKMGIEMLDEKISSLIDISEAMKGLLNDMEKHYIEKEND